MSNTLANLGSSLSTAVGIDNNGTLPKQPTDPESELIKKIKEVQGAYRDQINSITNSVNLHVQTLINVQSSLSHKIKNFEDKSNNLTRQQDEALNFMSDEMTKIGESTKQLEDKVTEATKIGEDLNRQLGIDSSLNANSAPVIPQSDIQNMQPIDKIKNIKNELISKGVDITKDKNLFTRMNGYFTDGELDKEIRKVYKNEEQVKTIKEIYNKYFPNNQQQGGYLSIPRRRKRNMKSNSTRNFFKFTSKRGVKKANKKSRKKGKKGKN
jgi:hypothetical protein